MTAQARRTLIIGAGMAGLSCARNLHEAGHPVVVLDKGRGPGGRLSTRRLQTSFGDLAFDHGAPGFRGADPAFLQQLAAWADAGVVAPWPAGGAGIWVGMPGMNAPIRALTAGLDVRWSARVETITCVAAGWQVSGEGVPEDLATFDALVVAIPPEQAGPLLAPHAAAMAEVAAGVVSEPCWVAMLAFARALPTEVASLRDVGPIRWAARQASKPGRDGASAMHDGAPDAWVVQANPAWSQAMLESAADAVAHELCAALGDALGIAVPAPAAMAAHRWRYANSTGLALGALWDPQAALGVCGDWLQSGDVQGAWQSGCCLAGKMLESLVGTGSTPTDDLP